MIVAASAGRTENCGHIPKLLCDAIRFCTYHINKNHIKKEH